MVDPPAHRVRKSHLVLAVVAAMRVRAGAFLLLLTAVSGCAGAPSDDAGRTDPIQYETGVIFFDQDFVSTNPQSVAYHLDVPEGVRNVSLEIRQDPGSIADLRVTLTGCGRADIDASSSWQTFQLCDEARSGGQVVRVEVGGAATGTGQLLLRGDIPSGT